MGLRRATGLLGCVMVCVAACGQGGVGTSKPVAREMNGPAKGGVRAEHRGMKDGLDKREEHDSGMRTDVGAAESVAADGSNQPVSVKTIVPESNPPPAPGSGSGSSALTTALTAQTDSAVAIVPLSNTTSQAGDTGATASSATPQATASPIPTIVPTAPAASAAPVAPADPCVGGTVLESNVNVVLAASAQSCMWNANGNGAEAVGVVTARSVRTATIPVPADSKVCALKVSAPAQQFSFDDDVFLTLGDVLLYSSQNHNGLFAKRSGFALFDWSRIKGSPLKSGQGPYCLGAAEGVSSCVVPPSPTVGELSMRFDDAMLRRATDAARPASTITPWSVSLYAIGDDDASDCQHGKLDLRVTVSYAKTK